MMMRMNPIIHLRQKESFRPSKTSDEVLPSFTSLVFFDSPKLQNAFKNIASPPYQPTTAISALIIYYLAWETVFRENIQILNHVSWLKSAIEKATNETLT